MGQIKIEIKNLQTVLKKIKAMEKAGEKAVSYTVKDVKGRAPSWVAQEVTKTYNISKKELVPSKDGSSKKMAGTLRVKGDTIEQLVLVYKGRPLTHLHFSVTPKKPKPLTEKYQATPTAGTTLKLKGAPAAEYAMVRTRKPYDIYVTVFKGKKKKLSGEFGTSPFLAPARPGSSTYIPFQRTPGGKFAVQSFHGPSVPQMVENPEVNTRIYDRLSEESEKRLRNNMKRFMKV